MMDLDFRLMAIAYWVGDFLRPRRRILREVDIKPGFAMVDYGCGPGSYVLVVAELVGEEGKVYALDVHPRALQMVRRRAANKHLGNVHTVLSPCSTYLPDGAIEVAVLYDFLHDLKEPEAVLRELWRVLSPRARFL
ncbi:MAG: methyltransferase domain-containing protein [bacterium]|jgi:ubiquinone/menaquinone biosynthesis C-methylase UbiE|nr:class I SAM-dependent methyltransferase [candidate division KSB1 bacterium]MDH7560254.1 methyltransferase domain-containing protein [bacterium]